MAKLMKSAHFDRPHVHVALIVLLGLAAYSNTFGVPFVYDDLYTTVNNPLIKDVSNIPSLFAGLKGPWASRPLMHATLALNYHFGGLDPRGYHAVNLALHLANGILLYVLVAMTGRHLRYADAEIRTVALAGSLLFVLHPVQTEAVTYITSRSMLLATAFYLMGMVFFLKAVTAEKGKWLYIAGLLVSSLLGMASRENFLTFPLMLFLYDLFFISGFRPKDAARHWRAYLPVLMSLAYLVFLSLYNTYDRNSRFPGEGIPPVEYMLTQLKVHWIYLRLLLLPVGQNLDYDLRTAKTLFEFPTMLSFLGYVGLWTAALALLRKRPVASFLIIWFLVALSPVSFVLALAGALMDTRLGDVIAEHRIYLPSAGVFIAVAYGAAALARRGEWPRRGFTTALLVLVCLVFLVATYSRNAVWQSHKSLWEDVVRKSPEKYRGHYNLGNVYRSEGRFDEAAQQYLITMRLKPDFERTYINFGLIYYALGRTDEAIAQFQEALRFKPDYVLGHYKLALLYYATEGMMDRAIEQFRATLRLRPNYPEAHYSLGMAYYSKGLTDEAVKHIETALRLKPDYEEARRELENIRSGNFK